MGYTRTRMGQNSYFTHMHMSVHMRIGMLIGAYTRIATAMTVGVATMGF